MFSEIVLPFTEKEKTGSAISTENKEKGEDLIIKMFHEKVDKNQQSKKSKKKNDFYLDDYFTKSLSLRMQFMSKIIKFEKSDQQPFVYEDFDLEIQHKELQATSIFIYDRINNSQPVTR